MTQPPRDRLSVRAEGPARPSSGRAGALGTSIALYVHIPFCAARCPYCDFATAPARSPLRSRYLATLAREIALQGARLSTWAAPGKGSARRRGLLLGRPRARTLYFGGGTPSLLEPEELSSLMAALRVAFDLRPGEKEAARPGEALPPGRPSFEFTLEANPATLAPRRLAAFVAAGVTRISLGAQSLQPAGLKALARTHTVEDVRRSVEAIRAAGVRSLNLDLIFGWPRQSRAAWRAELEAALALAPDHLSCYPLTLELEPEEAVANWPGGGWATLARWRAAARAAQPEDDAVADMYVDAERILSRAGFEHYEIANWCRPGHRCRHNLAYWRSEDWLGVGLGAHSHLAGRRSWNPGRMDRYLLQWDEGVPQDGRSSESAEPWEAAMLALRLRRGLSFAGFARRFGRAALAGVLARLPALEGAGLLRWRADGVALTRRGRLLSNEVFVCLLPEGG